MLHVLTADQKTKEFFKKRPDIWLLSKTKKRGQKIRCTWYRVNKNRHEKLQIFMLHNLIIPFWTKNPVPTSSFSKNPVPKISVPNFATIKKACKHFNCTLFSKRFPILVIDLNTHFYKFDVDVDRLSCLQWTHKLFMSEDGKVTD